jgi:two-component system sensor histidine kinase BaeS
VSLRSRLALSFALVALATAAVVAIATPSIVGRGFARIVAGESAAPGAGAGQGRGQGQGPGQGLGIHAQQVQQETVVTLIAVALAAAGAASLLGVFIASRVARPLDTLADAAAAVAHGDLARRSGIADRSDELGSLGRSFDEMAAELEDAEASRRRFLQDVVHELKTPLTVIDATTSAVLDGVYPHDDRHLETIRDQSRLLARIVDDLRTIGLAEAGQLPLRLADASAHEAAAAVVRAFAVRAEEKGIRLGMAVPGGLTVRADADRLQQMLGALVDNAIRHTPADGDVSVEAAVAERGRARLVVRDTGAGVAPEDLPHVFDRFYQADPSRDRSTGTSGLGLAIVHALAAAQGGSVGVDPVVPHGAAFWVELPARSVDPTTAS